MTPELPPTKPYLLRAIWEWCSDNGLTPYIAVQVDARTSVPREYVRDGQIVLNLGSEATNRLQMGNDVIEFQARFGGVARELVIPVGQVLAIYARENGAGMAFDLLEPVPDTGDVSSAESPLASGAEDDGDSPPRPEPGRPHLQRIK